MTARTRSLGLFLASVGLLAAAALWFVQRERDAATVDVQASSDEPAPSESAALSEVPPEEPGRTAVTAAPVAATEPVTDPIVADAVPTGALARLRGRVTALENGAPIEAATVIAERGHELARTDTAADGAYELVFTDVVPTGVRVEAPGRTPERRSLPWVARGRARTLAEARADPGDWALDVELAAAAAVDVRILWEDGEPCEHARLSIREADSGGELHWLTHDAVVGKARTDAEGRARFAELPARPLVLEVSPRRLGLWQQFAFAPEPGATEERTFELLRPAVLELEVDGLEAWLGGGHAGTIGARAVGGSRGDTVRLSAWEGRLEPLRRGVPYDLEIEIEGYRAAMLAEGVELTQPLETLRVTMPELQPLAPPPEPEEEWSFAWTLVDPAGAGWTHERLARVGFDPFQLEILTGTDALARTERPLLSQGFHTGRLAGGATVAGDPPATAELTIGTAVVRVEGVTPESVIAFVLAPPADGPRLSRVDFVGALADGSEVPVLRAQIRAPDGSVARNAAYDIAPDRHRVYAWLPDGDYAYRAESLEHPAAHGRFRVAGAALEVQIPFRAAGVLVGRVEPPPGGLAAVLAGPLASEGLAPFDLTRVSAEGTFVVEGLAPGPHAVCLVRYDPAGGRHAAWSQPVEVESGSTTEVLVRCSTDALAVAVELELTGADAAWAQLVDDGGATLFAGPIKSGDRVHVLRAPARAHVLPALESSEVTGWDLPRTKTFPVPPPIDGVTRVSASF